MSTLVQPPRRPAHQARRMARRLARSLFHVLQLDRDGPLVGPAVLASLLSLARACGDDQHSHESLARRLESVAPASLAALDRMLSRLSEVDSLPEVLRETNALIDVAGSEAVSFLYQYTKEPLEEGAVANAHRAGGDKIAGRALLWATQFFTDDYLVRALTSDALGPIEREMAVENLRVIDPACGTGNFLLGAFDRLVAAHPGDRTVETAIAQTLIGYDIEQELAELSSLQLLAKAATFLGRLPESRPRCSYGSTGDERGSLVRDHNPLNALAAEGELRVFITNPPFLGRRLMSRNLRDYLRTEYPLAKNDLCAAFLLRCLEWLRDNDRAALVHQTNWMYLSTFAPLRNLLANSYSQERCTELGAHAFADVHGEKTRIALSVFVASPSSNSGTFVSLATHDLHGKQCALENGARVPSSRPSHRHWPLPSGLPSYGDFANPMQGTSTGDNARYVRWSWQVHADDADYRPVSKGGGYCKWRGLNRSVVRWGRAGELYRSLPGAALRNAERMATTELVFSDTGMLGLNVRILIPGQVFIASGPGIEVIVGSAWAHLAFLNSRLATTLLRALSPKLTTSAGYIRRLPCPAAIVHDPALMELARTAVSSCEASLRTTLTNDEHLPPAPCDSLEEAAEARLLAELQREAHRLDCEAAIEARVLEVFDLPVRLAAELTAHCGQPVACLPARPIETSMADLDQRLVSTLDATCRHRPRRNGPEGIGTGGPLEAVARSLNVAPRALLHHIEAHVKELPRTKTLFATDLVHQHTLRVLGITSDRRWPPGSRSVHDVVAELEPQLSASRGEPARLLSRSLEQWIGEVFPDLHRRAFRDAPIVVLEGDRLRTDRW